MSWWENKTITKHVGPPKSCQNIISEEQIFSQKGLEYRGKKLANQGKEYIYLKSMLLGKYDKYMYII